MIYTIGIRESYLACYTEHLAEGTPERWVKLGQHDDYPGGSVWPTREQAQAHVEKQANSDAWAVFGVLADWSQDTYRQPGQTAHNLRRDATLVILD